MRCFFRYSVIVRYSSDETGRIGNDKVIEISNLEQANQFIDSYYNRMNNEAVERFIQALTGVKVFVIDKPTKEQLKELTEYYVNSDKDAREHPIFLINNRPSARKQPDE